MNFFKRSNFIVHFSRYCFLPGFLYFFLFCVYTFPLILQFRTTFFTYPLLDGLQNVWNLWWVNKAVTQLHCSPWQTPYLHYPFGVTLLGHTLNPFNGFMAIPLLRFLTLLETYNLIVIVSFVASGLTTFYLAYSFSKSYWGSIIAGGHIYVLQLSFYSYADRPSSAYSDRMDTVIFLMCVSFDDYAKRLDFNCVCFCSFVSALV